MKNIKTNSIELPNGDIIIGCNGILEFREFFVKTSDGIFTYNEDEMDEIYGLVPFDTDLLGTSK